jgi:hypothetical protein
MMSCSLFRIALNAAMAHFQHLHIQLARGQAL